MTKRNGEAELNGQDHGIKTQIRGFVAQAVSIGLTISPSDLASKICKETGIMDERWARYTSVEIINRVNSELYHRTKKSERIVFIPHCLRNIKVCKASIGEEGYRCAKCGGCVVQSIVEECEKNDIKYFMVAGGSIVMKLIDKYQPKAVIGIACHNELKMALEKTGEKKIPTQVVLLSKDGCVNTEVDLSEVKEKLKD
ncbi:MAG: DUF116 domain-containing protein [Candidatus Micrarchaeota archaeon]